MPTSISHTPKRRLRDIVGNIRWQRPRTHLTVRKADNKPDAATNLQYFVTGLPKDASQSEKNDRIAELADRITNIKESDVFVISMWIS